MSGPKRYMASLVRGAVLRIWAVSVEVQPQAHRNGGHVVWVRPAASLYVVKCAKFTDTV